MYCKLLGEAVGELRGEKVKTKKEVRASVDYGLFVPEGYITDKEWRLRIYSRIAKVSSLKERDALLSDMSDVYGPVPDSVKNLVDVALIKNLAAGIGADKIVLKRGETSVGFAKIADIDNAVNSEATAMGGKLNALEASIKFVSASKMLKFLLNCAKLNR